MKLDELQIDSSSEEYQLRLQLIERAQQNDVSVFQTLCTPEDYLGARMYYKATKHIARGFKRAVPRMLANYQRELMRGQDNIEVLLAVKLLQLCAKFYDHECEVTKNMMIDYENYLLRGNLIRTFILRIPRDEVEEVSDNYDTSNNNKLF